MPDGEDPDYHNRQLTPRSKKTHQRKLNKLANRELRSRKKLAGMSNPVSEEDELELANYRLERESKRKKKKRKAVITLQEDVKDTIVDVLTEAENRVAVQEIVDATAEIQQQYAAVANTPGRKKLVKARIDTDVQVQKVESKAMKHTDLNDSTDALEKAQELLPSDDIVESVNPPPYDAPAPDVVNARPEGQPALPVAKKTTAPIFKKAPPRKAPPKKATAVPLKKVPAKTTTAAVFDIPSQSGYTANEGTYVALPETATESSSYEDPAFDPSLPFHEDTEDSLLAQEGEPDEEMRRTAMDTSSG
jgi:hypothetical protein